MPASNSSSVKTHRHVGRLVAHGEPISFRELCTKVVDAPTRYLVLDLDGTTHLKRNLGELFGWEIRAHHSYGTPAVERHEPRERGSRWVFDWEDPRGVARYLARGLRSWALPGANYLLWGKIASRSRWVRRAGFRKFHADPVRAVQPRVQTTLMNDLGTTPRSVLDLAMARVWNRHLDDQVIAPDDIRWLKERFPNLEVVLSSASPEPVVAFAAAQLGVDHAHYSTPDRINSGEAKIERLREAFPDFGQPGTEVVGISDTAHGEDHCWAKYFTKVADINSPTPFPPIVPVDSPLSEVHSATVLSRHERAARQNDPEYLDARRPKLVSQMRREFTVTDLSAGLSDLLERFNAIVVGADPFAHPDDLAYELAMLSESSRTRLGHVETQSPSRAVS